MHCEISGNISKTFKEGKKERVRERDIKKERKKIEAVQHY